MPQFCLSFEALTSLLASTLNFSKLAAQIPIVQWCLDYQSHQNILPSQSLLNIHFILHNNHIQHKHDKEPQEQFYETTEM